MTTDDTIVAISTAAGEGAIAVVRLSGKDAVNITAKFFKSKSGKMLENQKANTILFGEVVDNQDIIDEVLVSIFHSPHSYTGENIIEISCHGSFYIQQKILEIAINNGARLARPGEFTMRAFLNKKMDLLQAEAVADLIASRSRATQKVAINQLKGGFSTELEQLRNQLLKFVSLIELELDFSQEDVEFADRKQLCELIGQISRKLKLILSSFEYGDAIKNGIPVAIIGQPNAGKSTLLNTLLKDDKALVSNIAGTTRDTIEDVIMINGILFRFIDTAGLRNTKDKIENLGIERTIEKVKKAEIILYVVDASTDEKVSLYSKIEPYLSNKKVIIVLNKIDKKNLKFIDDDFSNSEIIKISAERRTNIENLEKLLKKTANFANFNENDIIITNTRHFEALSRSFNISTSIISAINSGISTDLLSADIREMLRYLGEITGDITNAEILGNIFKNFCIGK